ncbi:hypothetical protein [Mucilaginibacter ginsenosidivorax]|uniref:Uncharacterized protein n=1 Tax=Mucilaginibacter ginsenosidivorax TaxID=862126 RepID=A0A5B8VUT9_9SPHI|nr:hypothetical protein [Mucilaginibacter ginsenosidivorax]QEC75250.1 hypothetical protein FSB76_04595 [Mucilaginibacter ginsenosidivorax]
MEKWFGDLEEIKQAHKETNKFYFASALSSKGHSLFYRSIVPIEFAHTQSLHRLNNRSLKQENGQGRGKPKNKQPCPVYIPFTVFLRELIL